MIKLFFVSFLVLIVTSCHLTFCTWDIGYDAVNTQPYHENVKGLYSLTGGSRKYLADQGYNVDSCKLELRNDGLYIMNETPGIVFSSFGTSDTNYLTKQGKWSVSCGASDGCLMELEGICVEPLLAKNRKLAISITIGDPDECKGVIFEKVE